MIATRRGLFAGRKNDIQYRNGWRYRRRPDGRRHRRGLRAQAGLTVSINDVAEERVNAALATINGHLSRQVAKGQIDEAERKAILDRIQVAPTLDELGDCDLVVEAASENEEVKRKIFIALRSFLKPDAIVASNTSSISITRLASVTANPERFIGIHFMNPVPRMQLVELIRGIATRMRRSTPPRPSSLGSARRRRCPRIFPPSSSTASCCR